MTNENAINILRHLNPPRTSKADFDAFTQAIEMSIEALKEPKLIRCKECKWFGSIGCAIKTFLIWTDQQKTIFARMWKVGEE